MQKTKYILDLGSSYVSIYGSGLLLRQPNVAVVRRGNGIELISCGNDALAMREIPEHCSVVRPVAEGAVAHVEVMSLILKEFFAAVIPFSIFRAVEMYVLIPSGLSIAERENVEAAVSKAGYKDVTLIESVLALSSLFPGGNRAVAIMGSGTTEIGVVDKDGIVSACSVNIAGNTVTDKIIEQVYETYNLTISWSAAEKLKTTIGSLYDNDTSVTEVVGQDLLDGRMKSVEISASSIRAPILYCYRKIAEIIESVLTTIPYSRLAEVTANGLYIAGGGAELRGLEDFLTRYLKLKVYRDDDPETVVIRSAAKLVDEGRLFRR